MSRAIGRAATIARVVSACRALDELREWPFVGERIEAARAALAGAEGLDEKAIDRLADIAERWSSLDPRLRRFYGVLGASRFATDPSLDLALRRILLRDPAPLPGWRYAVLRSLWVDTYAVEPAIELVPIKPRPSR